ncbi:uncharacterized protein [Drosophila bipectinata]|uniref:uncharacterized protein n=1 Tax=Drosophila bipectinata TaxID=42026 RepID=UPI001C8AF646|nr:uncharacterized protein LOC108118781 [Drosophila bipectinata]
MIFRSSPALIPGLCLILHLIHNTHGARRWDYEPVSVQTFSSDESLLKITAKIDRVSRGEFAVSATVDFKYEPDDTTMVEAIAQRSASGDESDYKMLPFNIPKQPYTDFMNSHYKDVVIPNLGDCSNLVKFEDKFEPPWPQQVYVLDKCVANSDGFPEVVPEGFYRIIMNFTSPVDWGFIIVVKISNKLL